MCVCICVWAHMCLLGSGEETGEFLVHFSTEGKC